MKKVNEQKSFRLSFDAKMEELWNAVYVKVNVDPEDGKVWRVDLEKDHSASKGGSKEKLTLTGEEIRELLQGLRDLFPGGAP